MPNKRQFNDDQVRDIRQSHLSSRELAHQYGVSHRTIINIRDRRTCKNVPDQLEEEFRNQYVIDDPLRFLASLPDGYCGARRQEYVTDKPSNRPLKARTAEKQAAGASASAALLFLPPEIRDEK